MVIKDMSAVCEVLKIMSVLTADIANEMKIEYDNSEAFKYHLNETIIKLQEIHGGL